MPIDVVKGTHVMNLANSESTHQSKRKARDRTPRMRTINVVIVIVAAIMSLMLLNTTERATTTREEMRAATEEYIECSTATDNLGAASDYLTSCARLFSVTHETGFVADYYTEVNITKRRDEALVVLESYADNSVAEDYLAQALQWSNTLADREGRAMRLIAEGCGLPLKENLAPLANYELSKEESKLSAEEKIALGQDLLCGSEYRRQKSGIDLYVKQASSTLIQDAKDKLDLNANELDSLLFRQRVLTILLLVAVVGAIYLFIFFVLWPLASFSARISDGLSLVPTGAHELRLLADEYNILYEENRLRYDVMRHKADHDPLTGLFNRGAYDALLQDSTTNVALMLIDVDYFKTVNDEYGHETGDKILVKVADLLANTFRNTDFACRVGGDEFAVIVTNITPQLKHVIKDKIAVIRSGLADTSDGLPAVTLSIGIAFSDVNDANQGPEENLYERADRALYDVKRKGRDGYAFYDEVTRDQQ